MHDEFPSLPGYVSVKEAAQQLGISERRVYFYIETKRLPAVRAADVLLVSMTDLRAFQRQHAGRPRQHTPPWRLSSPANTQYMTTMVVPIRSGQFHSLRQRLLELKHRNHHLFPGTVARYISEPNDQQEPLEIVLIWRQTVMPDKAAREQALHAFRQDFEDLLAWSDAQYHHGTIFLHT